MNREFTLDEIDERDVQQRIKRLRVSQPSGAIPANAATASAAAAAGTTTLVDKYEDASNECNAVAKQYMRLKVPRGAYSSTERRAFYTKRSNLAAELLRVTRKHNRDSGLNDLLYPAIVCRELLAIDSATGCRFEKSVKTRGKKLYRVRPVPNTIPLLTKASKLKLGYRLQRFPYIYRKPSSVESQK